jgi:hypothetical protein
MDTAKLIAAATEAKQYGTAIFEKCAGRKRSRYNHRPILRKSAVVG